MISDQMLEKYVQFSYAVKSLEKSLAEIKKVILNEGVNSVVTEHYICVIRDQERTSLKPLEDVEAVLGADMVKEYNLTQTSTFKVVTVSKRDLIPT